MGFPVERRAHNSADDERTARAEEYFSADEADSDKAAERRPSNGPLDLLLAERATQGALADCAGEWLETGLLDFAGSEAASAAQVPDAPDLPRAQGQDGDGCCHVSQA